MAKRADFFQLVRDIQDRGSLACQPVERLEQDFHLLRGQHRGWLVHDQQFGFLQQAADDLDPLAFADRQVADDRIRVKRQLICGRNIADAF